MANLLHATEPVWELSEEQWQRLEPMLMNDEPVKLTKSTKAVGRRKGVLVVKNPYYVQATSNLADDQERVLKQGDTFAVFDHYGDIHPVGLGQQGIFHEGTRYLSCLSLKLGADRPLFLSSTVKEDNGLLSTDLTNPDVKLNDQIILPRGTLHMHRDKFLWQGACYERLRVRNYGGLPVEIAFSYHFEADFADIFEVRGAQRPRRGRMLRDITDDHSTLIGYEGLDGIIRRARVSFSPCPDELADSTAQYILRLEPKAEATVFVTVGCESVMKPPPYEGGARGVVPFLSYDQALTAAEALLHETQGHVCDIYTSNEQFNDWLKRSKTDLYMMVTPTAHGPYPYAGVPWFSTPFGRDGIITALESLWMDPQLARGVLAFLASTQATDVIPEQDAEPGKILHETRKGEMAALGEIPFGRYYGSVDSTPLFVMLAAAYYQRTGDRPFIESIWPNITSALEWIDRFGDRDDDGFVEYDRRTPKGLVHQGWKDSHDSVFHADGNDAHAPIALCEVQGYVYAAKRGAAELAKLLGHSSTSATLSLQADHLREKFHQAFWCDELNTYALALDGDKRPCRVRSSNVGHCLFTGIIPAEYAPHVARELLSEDSFCGWGVRTIPSNESRYNPMSYHNGSIWPHDNAMIAAGLSAYGLKDPVMRILTGLFDASLFVDLHRMPELFCGFHRRPGQGPTLYPVACAPQSWAAAAVFMLLEACLGLRIDAPRSQISFTYPVLPPSLREIRISQLRVGSASVDLLLQRHGNDVGVNVLDRTGKIEVVTVK